MSFTGHAFYYVIDSIEDGLIIICGLINTDYLYSDCAPGKFRVSSRNGNLEQSVSLNYHSQTIENFYEIVSVI